MSVIAAALAIVLAAVSVGLLSHAFSGSLNEAARSLQVRSKIQGSRGVSHFAKERIGISQWRAIVTQALVGGGIPWLRKASRIALRIRLIDSYCQSITDALRIRGIDAGKEEACQVGMFALCIGMALTWLACGSPWAAVGVAILCALALRFWSNQVVSRFNDRIVDQIPDAFRALSVYYGAGLTLTQAIEQSASDIEDPLGVVLRDVNDSMKAGVPVSESLQRMRGVGCEQLEYLSVILDIHQRTGGSLQPLLERGAQSVCASKSLKRSLQVLTASGQMSARIVTAMPLAIFALMAIVDPDCIGAFFSSAAGVCMFALAIALQAVGILFVRRILDVGQG